MKMGVNEQWDKEQFAEECKPGGSLADSWDMVKVKDGTCVDTNNSKENDNNA